MKDFANYVQSKSDAQFGPKRTWAERSGSNHQIHNKIENHTKINSRIWKIVSYIIFLIVLNRIFEISSRSRNSLVENCTKTSFRGERTSFFCLKKTRFITGLWSPCPFILWLYSTMKISKFIFGFRNFFWSKIVKKIPFWCFMSFYLLFREIWRTFAFFMFFW